MKLLLIALAVSAVSASQLLPSCDRPVYCNSKLLHYVQLARIFPDSKTFVDLHMKSDEGTILNAFDVLLQRTHEQPSKQQLQEFLKEHFESIEELESWTPEDYKKEPEFLLKINDIELRQFARNIHNIWPILGRKVSPQVLANPESFSMLPVNNGFIIPGVRLNEMYYWDTYWIIEGLLVSGMTDTVKGILSNFLDLQRTFGHIPNGNRWYFQQRSQPPLLSAMVMKYLEATHDVEFLKSNIDALENELKYWIDTQSVIFKKNGKQHTLLRYYTPSSGPRPEWYYEDYTQAQKFPSEEFQQQYYSNIKSAAESGWDFSSRWFINENGTNIGDISTTRASDIVPVDLNAVFTNCMQNMAYYYSLMHNSRKGAHWAHIAKQFRNSINEVMWNDEDGIWYDWDLLNDRQRKYFYPSNIAPLWMDVVDEEFKKEHAQAILEYLKKTHSLEFPGGVPTSLSRSGQKWDYPYAWAPLVSMVVKSLEALKTEESEKLAFEVAKNWVRSNLLGYNTYKQLFDKYDVETPGKISSEDIYTLYAGFGWTIGATLQMLTKYGNTLKAQDSYYNFHTYKPNPVFWHIPTSAYLPAYYKSVKTAPVFTSSLSQVENVSSNLNSDKTSIISSVSNEQVSETVEPETQVIIIQSDPTKPSYEIEKEIDLFSTIKPEYIHAVPLKAQLATVNTVRPQLVPSVPVKPSLPLKPEIVKPVPVKPELVQSAQIKPELIPLKPEVVPLNTQVIPAVHQNSLYPAQISSSYGSNLHISEVAHDLVVPSGSATPVKPQVIPSVHPELTPSASIKPIEYTDDVFYNKPAVHEEEAFILSDLPQAEKFDASLEGHLASDISSFESAILHAESPNVEEVAPAVQPGYVAQSGHYASGFGGSSESIYDAPGVFSLAG